MRRILCSIASLGLAILLTAAGSAPQNGDRFHLAESHDGVITTSGSGARFKAGAGADTFCLYGGPGSLLGKFQHADGSAVTEAELLSEPTTVAGEADGWVFHDATDQETFWQRHTYKMDNLNSHGAGNHGMWAGRDATQVGWTNAPGYGNGWNALLTWRATVANPEMGQIVQLDFVYNLDSEFSYDFLEVNVDQGFTNQVFSQSGTTRVGGGPGVGTFPAPGTAASLSIPFTGDDYGNGNTEIVIRISANSDGAYSDADGIIDTEGLAQVDDISVSWDSDGDGVNETTSFEDFEGSAPFQWVPEAPPFSGYFGKVFSHIQTPDPCRQNTTPVFAFIDDGTPPSNPSYTGTGTGGTTSINWTYGVPAGWVVNYNGGLTANLISLDNHLFTPPVAWDLSGTADDAPDVAGAFFRTTIWRHVPLFNGICYLWNVRARDSGTQEWTDWVDRGFAYYGGGFTGDWINAQMDVSDLVRTANGPDAVQLDLQLLDAAFIFAFPGTDATVSPFFDNVGWFKYRIGGPTITTRAIDLFNDSFSQSGLAAHATQAERDQLDVRLDMARDVSTGSQILPGDSIIVDITSVVPGNTIAAADIRLTWALHTNPYFEDAIRPALTGGSGVTGAYTEGAGTGYNGWDVWTGVESVVGGATVANKRYAFDLPDADFMYPGDILEWYVEATDSGGATGGTPLTSSFPADIAGFNDGDKHTYSRLHTVRALPTITANGQPDLLLVNDFGHRGGENDYLSAFGQIGFEEGARAAHGAEPGDFDTYTVRGPSSGIDNGIGSEGAHGADASQLSDYRSILYVAGDLSAFLLSNGTNLGLNDKGDDLGNLTDWHNQAADRNTVYFGDNIATSVSWSSITYLNAIAGVAYNGADVKSELGGTVAPLVRPSAAGASAGFVADWVAFGGCLRINAFDSISPYSVGAANYASHEFIGGTGMAPATATGGVVFDRIEGGHRKVNVTFPFGFVYIYNGGSTGAGGGLSDRSVLLSELMTLFSHSGGGDVVDAELPAPGSLRVDGNFPNPFNPSTEIRFTIGVQGPVTIQIYNVAGRLVRTLAQDEVFSAGAQRVTWHGRDDAGATVASGVYLARVRANGFQQHAKLAMLK